MYRKVICAYSLSAWSRFASDVANSWWLLSLILDRSHSSVPVGLTVTQVVCGINSHFTALCYRFFSSGGGSAMPIAVVISVDGCCCLVKYLSESVLFCL